MPAEPATPTAVTSTTVGEVVVEDLTWLPDGRVDPVLEHISLHLQPGRRVGLLGPSGSGKSTLLRALAGVLASSGTGELTGRVSLDGLDPAEVPGGAGLLLQEPFDAVVADTVGRDVAFGPENLALARSDIWERVDHALDGVGFPFGGDRPTTMLSGGQAQRLSLAGALALTPRLLLLDEPTAMLDDAAASDLRDLVLRVVAARRTTLVVVEHRIGPWLEHLDSLIVLGPRGRPLAAGPVSQVLQEHRTDLLRAGLWLPGARDPAAQHVSIPFTRVAAAPPPVKGGLDVREVAVTVPADAERGRPAAEILHDVSLSVDPGSATSLTGPSGAGKSTLLRVVSGTLPPSRGTVDVAGEDPSSLTSPVLATHVALVPQHPGRSTVAGTVIEEILATTRALRRQQEGSPSEADETAERAAALELLTQLQLDQLADESPHQLSGGEGRRLALAAAVLHRPAVVLLDEPTVGQDRRTWAAVAGVIDALRREGVAVLVSTHDESIARQCDQHIALSTPAPPRSPVPSPSPATAHSRATQDSTPSVRQARVGLPAKCGPSSLLLVALFAAVAGLFVRNEVAAVTGVALLLAALPVLVRSPRQALQRLAPVLIAALSVGWSAWLLGEERSLTAALVAAARILVMVAPGALLMAFIDPSRLGDDLAQRVRLPARVVVACVVALQRIDHLRDVWGQLDDVRRVRALGPGRSPVQQVRHLVRLTFALLVESLRAANQTAVAMDARGFSAAQGRTWAEPPRWHRADSVAVLIGGIAAGLVIVAALIG